MTTAGAHRGFWILALLDIGVHDTNERIATTSLVEAAAFYVELIPAVARP